MKRAAPVTGALYKNVAVKSVILIEIKRKREGEREIYLARS